MPANSDQTPQEPKQPEQPDQPEVVAHDTDEEQPAWCVLNSSCTSVSVQE
jgi:hypothetical protein